MFKILGQLHFDTSTNNGSTYIAGTEEYDSLQALNERGEYRILYTVPAGKCAQCNVYVTRFRGDGTGGDADKQYKIHIIKKSYYDSNPYCTVGTIVPASGANELPGRPAHTSIGTEDIACSAKRGDKTNILTYFPERENKDYPERYEGIHLDEGDTINIFVRNGEFCFQAFGLELPNNMDTEAMQTMAAVQNLDVYVRTILGPSLKDAADYFTNTLGPNMNAFFTNHQSEVHTDIICASCP